MRRRIFGALVGLVAVSLGVFIAPLIGDEARQIRTNTDRDLRGDTARILSQIEVVLSNPNANLTDITNRQLHLRDAPDLVTGVYDHRAQRGSGSGPKDGGVAVRDALKGSATQETRNGIRALMEPIVQAGDVIGVIRVGEPVREMNSAIRRRQLLIAATAAAVLAAASLIAAWLTRRLLLPLAELERNADRLTDGDFSARVTTTHLSEINRVGSAFNAAAGRIERLVERERAFSSDVAHQLRTPITSLRTAIETEQIAPRNDHTLVLGEVLDDINRLETTVRDLLALSRDAPTDRSELRIDDLIGGAVAQWRPILARKQRRLEIEISSGSRPDVRASRSAVEQILSILLSNTEKHGAGTTTIGVTHNGPGRLDLTVTDEGPGVIGDIERVFRRRVSTGGGNGIGLSLAASLAHAEGATLTLDQSGPNPTFRLSLCDATHNPTRSADGPVRIDRRWQSAPRDDTARITQR